MRYNSVSANSWCEEFQAAAASSAPNHDGPPPPPARQLVHMVSLESEDPIQDPSVEDALGHGPQEELASPGAMSSPGERNPQEGSAGQDFINPGP